MGERTGQQQLAAGLVRLGFLVQREYGEVSRQHDLTPQQAQLVCVLLGGPIGMAELGGALHLEKSSLTGLVDRAERRGLVSRVRDARDRRAYRVALTQQGVELAACFHEHVSRRMAALAVDLCATDQAGLTAAINQILIGHGVAELFTDD
ncbi:MAG TPA: MarR family transcriptional regulator [Streptosporangiaceae bacterium]